MELYDRSTACCFTGYRPEKYDFPFDPDCREYSVMIRRLCTAVADMTEKGCRVFYSGMAKGFDLISAEHVALVKKLNKDIKLIGVIPFEGQERGWSREWRDRYAAVLSECDRTVVLEPSYTKWAYDRRNRYMVDHSSYCITYYDGKQGGTGSTLRYAVKQGISVLNIHDTDLVAAENERIKQYAQLYLPL